MGKDCGRGNEQLDEKALAVYHVAEGEGSGQKIPPDLPPRVFLSKCRESTKTDLLGTVYTDAVSFVTASVSMRLHLSFTRSRPSSLSKPGRFEYAFKSGAFSKRYGFEVV